MTPKDEVLLKQTLKKLDDAHDQIELLETNIEDYEETLKDIIAPDWNSKHQDQERVEARDLTISMTWRCGDDDGQDDEPGERSPIGYCVYANDETCIYCGSPEERK